MSTISVILSTGDARGDQVLRGGFGRINQNGQFQVDDLLKKIPVFDVMTGDLPNDDKQLFSPEGLMHLEIDPAHEATVKGAMLRSMLPRWNGMYAMTAHAGMTALMKAAIDAERRKVEQAGAQALQTLDSSSSRVILDVRFSNAFAPAGMDDSDNLIPGEISLSKLLPAIDSVTIHSIERTEPAAAPVSASPTASASTGLSAAERLRNIARPAPSSSPVAAVQPSLPATSTPEASTYADYQPLNAQPEMALNRSLARGYASGQAQLELVIHGDPMAAASLIKVAQALGGEMGPSLLSEPKLAVTEVEWLAEPVQTQASSESDAEQTPDPAPGM